MRVALAAITATLLMAVLAAGAQAAETRPFLSSFEVPGNNPIPVGIAVNETTHHVYITAESNGPSAAYELDASGGFIKELTGAPGFQSSIIAVDNSGGPHNGYIYTADPHQGQGVQQYDPSGVATSVRIDATDIPADGTPQGGGLPNVVNNGEFGVRAVTVDSSGAVYVSDEKNRAIDVFSPAGAFVRQVGAGLADVPNFIAVDVAGNIYIPSRTGVYELDAAGNCVESCARINSLDSHGVAIAPSGNVLVAEEINETQGKEQGLISEYSPSRALVSRTGPENLRGPLGIAIEGSTDKVYVADFLPIHEGTGRIFGPAFIIPDAITEAASAVSDHGASLHGKVGAAGGPDATCAFQYVEETSFEASGFTEAKSAPCEPGGPFSGEAQQTVSAEVSLRGGTTYHYRLRAVSSNGPNVGEDLPFTTKGPSVSAPTVSEITETEATFSATVNPNGGETTYRFQYVSQEQFEESGFAEAKESPLGGEVIGSGTEAVKVTQQVSGLAPGNAYRVRVFAGSTTGEDAGATEGLEAGFATYAPALQGLPDGRAYEQASPLDKDGASVQGETNAVQAAADGSGITFYSVLGIPGGEGAQQPPSYLASRAADASGWSTQGLLPPAATGPTGRLVGWSEDLTRAYGVNKVIGSPEALYQRQSADHQLTKIADGEGENSRQFNFAAASADGSAVLFENTVSPLTPGAVPGKSNAYLWDRETETVHLAGVLNDGSAPPAGSFAGAYDWYREKETTTGSAAGSYYLQSQHALSQDGSRLFFTAAGTGRLYLRANPAEAQSPLDGGGDCTDPSLACTVEVSASQRAVPDPVGEKPAAFLGASADGSEVFFSSAAKLTDDATTGSGDTGNDLYRYDASSGELTDLAPDGADANGADLQGLLGTSTDGSYVYFAANGVLAPGATAGSCQGDVRTGECSVYLAHEGAISFVARVRLAAVAKDSDLLNWAPTPNSPGNGQTQENTARVSPDGQTLLFRSRAGLGAYDSEGQFELYRYRADAKGLACVSCNPTEAAPSGPASLQALPEREVSPKLSYGVKTRNLSADGNRVFFDSPDKLVASDTNGVNDVYEWEAKGTGSCDSEDQDGGCLFLISSGASPEPSYFGDADVEGDNAFFFTEDQLVGQDRDELVDVYDARVGGGIAAQNPPVVPICEGEACKGPVPSQPLGQSAGSASFNGPHNAKPNRQAKKHKKHRKKTKKKKARGHHAAKKGARR